MSDYCAISARVSPRLLSATPIFLGHVARRTVILLRCAFSLRSLLSLTQLTMRTFTHSLLDKFVIFSIIFYIDFFTNKILIDIII